MNVNVAAVVSVVAYLLLAPLFGGLLAGADRRITARMQGRVGPPLLQPFYDVLKLREKEDITVNRVQDAYVACCLVFMVITGALFFAGGDLLMVIFALTLASIFLVLAAYSSNSPYAQVGASRELLQMMAYEPMVLLTAVGFYMAAGSFSVRDILGGSFMPIIALPGFFIGFVYVLTIKLRKSPFDLSTSHHGHQELVKGLTTELSGKTMALVEISHWYENVFLLGFIFLFFAYSPAWSIVLGIAMVLLIYLFEILIDNSFARMKWQFTLKSSWLVAASFGFVNLLVLYFVRLF